MRAWVAIAFGLLVVCLLAPRSAEAAPDPRRWNSVEALLADVAPDARLARPVGPDSDGVFGEALGSAVALSGDTLLVGAPEDRIARLGILGSVYVFVREPAGWRLDTKLLAPDGAAGDRFGAGVALSGDTALVGAPGDDVGADADRGAAHVFVRSASGWTWQARLDAAGSDVGDRFGASVALEADRALVGAPGVAVGGIAGLGAAWVFQRAGTTWSEQARLAAADAAANDAFGSAVALSGSRAVVGAPQRAAVGGAYVFERDVSTWTQQAVLVPGAAGGGRAGARVALAGDTIVLGEPRWGQAFVFVRVGATWLQQAVLDPPAGESGAAYGDAVAVSGDLVAVGQPMAHVDGVAGRGSAEVWRRVAGVWTRVHRITPPATSPHAFGSTVALDGARLVVGAPDAGAAPTISGAASVFEGADATLGAPIVLGAGSGPNGSMGEAVAIDGDTLVLGAPFERVFGFAGAGAVYVYVRSNGEWSLQQRLTAPSTGPDASLGRAVAIDGDTIVVGAPGYRVLNFPGFNQPQGSAWVFVRTGVQWNVQEWLVAGGGELFDFFGSAVAIDGDTIAAGIPGARIGTDSGQGAVEIFRRSGSTWSVQARLVSGETGFLQQFGGSLALQGNRLVAGAWRLGAAWVFERGGSGWTRTARLDFRTPGDQFGWSLALDGDHLLVGAPGRTLAGAAARGAVDAFQHSDGQWVPRGQLVASDGQAEDFFGWSLALQGETAVIGNFPGNGGPPRPSEAAYMFERRGNGWRQDARWRPQDLAIFDGFGSAVALSGRTAIIGAPSAASPAPWGNPGEGAGYVYTHAPNAVFFDDFEP